MQLAFGVNGNCDDIENHVRAQPSVRTERKTHRSTIVFNSEHRVTPNSCENALARCMHRSDPWCDYLPQESKARNKVRQQSIRPNQTISHSNARVARLPWMHLRMDHIAAAAATIITTHLRIFLVKQKMYLRASGGARAVSISWYVTLARCECVVRVYIISLTILRSISCFIQSFLSLRSANRSERTNRIC